MEESDSRGQGFELRATTLEIGGGAGGRAGGVMRQLAQQRLVARRGGGGAASVVGGMRVMGWDGGVALAITGRDGGTSRMKTMKGAAPMKGSCDGPNARWVTH
jgi:hypothetical protein